MKCLVLVMVTMAAVFVFAGCKGQLTVKDPRQELSVNPVTFNNGSADVEIIYTVSNPDKNPVTVRFNSSKQWDAWVMLDGKEVFRESSGKMYTQALTQLTLQPGEKKEFKTIWKLSLEPGAYEAGTKYEVRAGLVTKDLDPLTVIVVPVP
ncbi:MAG: BsuPI-related putative proteinase inhibitor [Armatimonadetes bacterium]|nr:BsuPI-related putative proteinase inhibitor [Armatimonadota bacterium]